MQRKTFTGKINNLKDNEIFVFGSNPVGIQGAGAAKVASDNNWCKRNEIMDNTLSECGKAYGLVTVKYPGARRSVSKNDLINNIKKLYNVAINNPTKIFLIAYTGKKSRNLNGYTNTELAYCFSRNEIPSNIVFQKQYYSLIKEYLSSGKKSII